MTSYRTIWSHGAAKFDASVRDTLLHQKDKVLNNRDDDAGFKCLKRANTEEEGSHSCKHHHKHQKIRDEGKVPKAPFKTRMCSRWLSGCYLGDRCPFAHRTEDLFKPFYTPEMIDFYEQMIGLQIDDKHMSRLCKDIFDLTCEDSKGECLFFGNNSMSNKRLQIHLPTHQCKMMPHCTVTCNTCQHVKKIDIYSFMVLKMDLMDK